MRVDDGHGVLHPSSMSVADNARGMLLSSAFGSASRSLFCGRGSGLCAVFFRWDVSGCRVLRIS